MAYFHVNLNQKIYPSSRFAETYDTITPKVFAGIVSFTFVMVAVVFFVYDMIVQKRNNKVIMNAARSNAIVSQLFPGKIRDQIIARKEEEILVMRGAKQNLKMFVNGDDEGCKASSAPIAELFLETTILFADIVGFTAW